MDSCIFDNNIAMEQTAGIFITFSNVTITNTNFNNSRFETYAPEDYLDETTKLTGGFLLINTGVYLSISTCQFWNGYANQGGAIYLSGQSKMTIQSSTFIGNKADQNAGDIYLSDYNLVEISWTFLGYQYAYGKAHSIYSSSGRLRIKQYQYHSFRFVPRPSNNVVSLITH